MGKSPESSGAIIPTIRGLAPPRSAQLVTTATPKHRKMRDMAVYNRAAHVRRTSEATAVLLTVGIIRRWRPARTVVYSACRWAISGTTKCQMSGALRP